jgi:hypothetical protein
MREFIPRQRHGIQRLIDAHDWDFLPDQYNKWIRPTSCTEGLHYAAARIRGYRDGTLLGGKLAKPPLPR